MATEKEKMIAERFYIATDPQLTAERTAARKLCDEFNRTTGNIFKSLHQINLQGPVDYFTKKSQAQRSSLRKLIGAAADNLRSRQAIQSCWKH